MSDRFPQEKNGSPVGDGTIDPVERRLAGVLETIENWGRKMVTGKSGEKSRAGQGISHIA
jgi:hypothetical protein